MVLPLLTLALTPLVQVPEASPPVRVDLGSPGALEDADIAISDGRAFAAWSVTVGAAQTQMIWGAASVDHGHSWTAPFRIDQDPGLAFRTFAPGATLFADGHLLVGWLDRRGSPGDAFLRRRPAGAAGFDPEVRLDSGQPFGFAEVKAVRLAADGAKVVALLVVHPLMSVDDQLVVLRSTDGGASFSAPTVVHTSAAGVHDPELVVDGDDIHLSWQHPQAGGFGLFEMQYQHSGDFGQSWLPTAIDPAVGGTVEPGQSHLDVDGDRIAVVYGEVSALCGVSVVLSHDRGQTWTAPARVGTSMSPGCVDRHPQVFLANGHVVVTWNDDRLGVLHTRSHIAWSDDDGASWVEQPLAAVDAEQPRLLGDHRNGVFAVFFDEFGLRKTKARWSRATTPFLGPTPLEIGDYAPLENVDRLRFAFDPRYAEYLSLWRQLDLVGGTSSLWVSAFRNAQVEAIGSFQPGSAAGFLTFGYPEAEAGAAFQVLIAKSAGNATLPFGDGRHLGLAHDPFFAFTSSSPQFRGLVVAGGGGSISTTVPLGLASGTTLHFAAVSYLRNPIRFGSITPVRTVTIP